MPTDFTHLHVHTEFSVLDGLGTVQHYVDKAVEHGMSALAVTDHGNMCAHPTFYHACRKAGIEPILGQEFYFVDDVAWRPARGSRETPDRYHVVMLARGRRGYQVLSELSTEGHRNYYHKPIIDASILDGLSQKDRESLVVLSGCAASIISEAIRRGDQDAAREWLLWWRESFPHFYIELQHHDTEFDLQLNAGLIDLARRYSVPWVVTNDPHYVVKEDHAHHDTLLAIQTAADIDDPARFRFDGDGYHLRTRAEMARVFRRHYEAEVWTQGCRNTARVARLCKTRLPFWETRTWQFPEFADAEGDAYGVLKRLAWSGLRERGLRDRPEYVERLKHELRAIKQAGVSDFLLITRWCVQAGKDAGIPVGPGRGSVCGCLVAYLVGIHKIDPVKYKLRFDRFLNIARPRMPDIDTDFGQSGREKMFDIVAEKFGPENVVKVAAYDNMQVKRAFQSIAKAHGISYPDRIRISKLLTKDEEQEYALPEEITLGFPELAAQLHRLAGVRCGLKAHPAGVIIASPEMKLGKLVPQMWIASSKKFVGQYDLDAAEETGLLKEDFLGLRTLDTIEECLKFIERDEGERLDPDAWLPDEEEGDDEVYKMLAAGRTQGVFQCEGPVLARGLQAVGVVDFEDIVSCTSLYRTGPIDAGYPAIFIRNRESGREDIPYVHPLLKPILEDTWGVILYQEQVMDIAEKLAGFDMGQVDDIKEAIKHKRGPLMKSMRPLFVRGCRRTNNIPKEISLSIWKDIEGYSGYSYNRSHAVAYSFTSYQTARLKRHWFPQFMTALVRTVPTSTPEGKERRENYMREMAEWGMKILPPCVNNSEAEATLEWDDDKPGLRLGLADISGIGDSVATKVLEGRPEGGYSDPAEVAAAVRNVGKEGILGASGALLCVGVAPDRTRQEELLRWSFRDRMRRIRMEYENDVMLPTGTGEDEDDCCIVGEIYKVTRGSTKTGKPYLTWKLRWSPSQAFDVRLWSSTERHWGIGVGSIVMVHGTWEGRWQNMSVGNPRAVTLLRRERGSEQSA